MLRVYLQERGPSLIQQATLHESIARLIPYWGGKMVGDIKGRTCREFAQRIGKLPSARRSLETLRAAINWYHKEYGIENLPAVTLPEKPAAREAWLTRSEAARLLWAARRTPHLARFILIGLYTGTRSAAILGLRWMPNVTGGWLDVERGLMYRAAVGARRSNKRQPTAKIPDKLLNHCRRWRRMDAADIAVVHYYGKDVGSIKKAFREARKRAKLPATTIPHILRHTSVTWAMQGGIDLWQACGFYGLTMETLQEHYGHHHPDFQKDFERAF